MVKLVVGALMLVALRGADAQAACAPGSVRQNGVCSPCPINTYPNNGVCADCPAGSTSTAGSANCTICPAGRYVTGVGRLRNCEPCPLNTYSNTTGSSQCRDCPTGYVAQPGSTRCSACLPGTYYGQQNFSTPYQCLPCPEGSFSTTTAATSCQKCPFGQTSQQGGTACTPCPPGNYVQSDTNAGDDYGRCLPCEENTANNVPSYSGTGCPACPPGSTAPEGATECTICPAGAYVDTSYDYYQACVACEANTFNNRSGLASSTGCEPCPEGTVSNQGATSCEICPVGWYIDTSFYLTCLRCPMNSYNDVPGYKDVGCPVCPTGTTSPEGSSSCTTYPAGWYVDTTYPSVKVCKRCDRNTYNPEPGLEGTECESCPAGYVSEVGSTECVPCPAGSYVTEQGYCEACEPGFYSAAPGSASCNPCPDGSTSRPGASAAEQCVPCPAGKFLQRRETGSVCVPCEANTYSDVPGAVDKCTACPELHVSPEGARCAAQCVLCPVGSHFEVSELGEVSATCTPCPANTFGNVTSLIGDCYSCPVGYVSEPGSSRCTACPAGSYVDGIDKCADPPCTSLDASCLPCKAGFYNPKEAQTECLKCPVGSSSKGGATECEECGGSNSGTLDPDGVAVCEACEALTAAGAATCPAGQGRLDGCCPSDECIGCPAGTYAAPSPDLGRDACVPCPIGAISTPGATSCTPCPEGQTTDAIGSDKCVPCKPGYRWVSLLDAGVCVPCVHDTYLASVTTCETCPTGKTHFVMARTKVEDCAMSYDPYVEGGERLALQEEVVYLSVQMYFSSGSTTRQEIRRVTEARGVAAGSGERLESTQAYTTESKMVLSAESVASGGDEPVTKPLPAPVPTSAKGYRIFKLTGYSGRYGVSVEYRDGTWLSFSGVRPAGGKLVITCARVLTSISSFDPESGNGQSLTVTETIMLTEA